MELKPMLFNTEMVRAILSGQKTCTRRVVKPRFGGSLEVHEDVAGTPRLCEKCGALCHGLKPPCRPGDILYVRETFGYDAFAAWNKQVYYKADYPDGACKYVCRPGCKSGWYPSIHMPKEAARIFLRVTDVRVERLQKIPGDGCAMEGIPLYSGPVGERENYYRNAFSVLWDSTIKHTDLDRYGWAANPWVWVIEFERISKEAALGGEHDAKS